MFCLHGVRAIRRRTRYFIILCYCRRRRRHNNIIYIVPQMRDASQLRTQYLPIHYYNVYVYREERERERERGTF